MSETPASYTIGWTGPMAIRNVLRVNGPMTLLEIAQATDIPQDQVAEIVFSLANRGDVILIGDLVKLTKATNLAKDERKEPGVSYPTTTPLECARKKIWPPSDDAPKSPHTDCRGDPISAVAAIQAVADLADLCRELTAENARLRKRLTLLQDAVDNLVAVSLGNQARKIKLGDELS